MFSETEAAFPHMPPASHIRASYAQVFSTYAAPPDRTIKLVFDKAFSLSALMILSPVIVLIFVSHLLISTPCPDQRGPLVISYRAVSKGKPFSKYKLRVVKQTCVDGPGALRGDWHAYAAEWNPGSLTYLGVFLKMFYLDELPQLFNILSGDMSVVGPRPLAEHHYERDVSQGNVYRRLLKAGLFGPSQALKGTSAYGNPEEEYKYAEKYLNSSAPGLLWYDLKLIARGVRVVVSGKGL